MYLNSGDWVEQLTALEYEEGAWSLHTHERAQVVEADEEPTEVEYAGSNRQLFQRMLLEFELA